MLFHQPHHLVVHVGTVLDAGHAAEDGALHALLAVRVRRHAEPVVACGVDDGLHFVHGELRRVAGLGVAQHPAGGGDLDDVAAVLVALAHGLAGVVDGIDDTLGRPGRAHQVRQVGIEAVGGIGVPAGGGDGGARGEDARPLHGALVDGVAQVQGHVSPEVAHAGEAGHQRLLRIAHRAVGEVHRIQAEALRIALRAGFAVQVDVQVGPSRRAGVICQDDGFGVGQLGAARDDLGDPAVADQHGVLAQDLAAAGVEHPFAVQRQGAGRCRPGGQGIRDSGQAAGGQSEGKGGSVHLDSPVSTRPC